MGIGAWHIMREKVSIGPDATIQDAAMKMISSALPAMPVVNADHEILGIVMEIAVLNAIREGQNLENTPASTIMVPAPIIADATVSPDDLVKMLMESCCSLVLVVRDKKYVGVVSRHMLMDIFTSPHYSRFAARERKAPFACK